MTSHKMELTYRYCNMQIVKFKFKTQKLIRVFQVLISFQTYQFSKLKRASRSFPFVCFLSVSIYCETIRCHKLTYRSKDPMNCNKSWYNWCYIVLIYLIRLIDLLCRTLNRILYGKYKGWVLVWKYNYQRLQCSSRQGIILMRPPLSL